MTVACPRSSGLEVVSFGSGGLGPSAHGRRRAACRGQGSIAASTAASTADTDSFFFWEIHYLKSCGVYNLLGSLCLQLSYLGPSDVSALAATAIAFNEFLQDFTLELAVRIFHGFVVCLLQRRRYEQAGS